VASTSNWSSKCVVLTRRKWPAWQIQPRVDLHSTYVIREDGPRWRVPDDCLLSNHIDSRHQNSTFVHLLHVPTKHAHVARHRNRRRRRRSRQLHSSDQQILEFGDCLLSAVDHPDSIHDPHFHLRRIQKTLHSSTRNWQQNSFVINWQQNSFVMNWQQNSFVMKWQQNSAVLMWINTKLVFQQASSSKTSLNYIQLSIQMSYCYRKPRLAWLHQLGCLQLFILRGMCYVQKISFMFRNVKQVIFHQWLHSNW